MITKIYVNLNWRAETGPRVEIKCEAGVCGGVGSGEVIICAGDRQIQSAMSLLIAN